MRVLFSTLRNTSHFLPLVPFLDACQRAGYEVAVAAPPDLAERVAATGAKFFPFGHPGDDGLRPIWQRLRGVSEEDAKRIAIGELFAGACAGAALPGLIETIEHWRPALVVRESQEYAALVAAEKAGIPHVRVAISAHSGEAQVMPFAVPAIDAHGQSVGLSPDPLGNRLHGEAALSMFPASLELPGANHAPLFRFRVARQEPPPLPNWWGSQAGPFVYVTFGTVIGTMEARRNVYRTVLDALSGMSVRALLTIGADLPTDALGEPPANVHVERFIPQGDVLPHAAAVLCHGGSGTLLGTLACGVPLVVAPQFADQPFNAQRVAEVGAGIALPPANAQVQDLRQALARVLAEPSFRAAAARVAAEMNELPLVEDAPKVLAALALRR